MMEQIEPRGIRHHLDGGDEREIGDGSVASREKNEIAPCPDLSRNALQIIARTIHEVESRRAHRRRVVDHVIDTHLRVFLARGSN